MLNKEKYAKEIVEIAITGDTLAVSNGKPVSCYGSSCEDCDFYHLGDKVYKCTHELKEWANSEYKEEK